MELISCGAVVGVLDADRRLPLHIAAASLNLDVVDYLVDQHGNSFLSDVDKCGNTPLDQLLRSVSLSKWWKRISPARLILSVTKLIGSTDSLWVTDDTVTVSIANSGAVERIHSRSLFRCKLFAVLYSIRGCDDKVAVHVVNLARSCSSTIWNVFRPCCSNQRL